MSFEVRITRQLAGDRAGDVYELIDADESVRAEVWPQWGFNCLRWQVRQRDGRWGDILYSAPDWESNPVPTRSGHPILFPFPGRMAAGRFIANGSEYHLPLNDATKQHAIHGFTPRNPWRVADWNGDDGFAFVTGEFSLAKDLPGAVTQWPADFKLNVTYRLYHNKLRVDATVENLGRIALPFGLGYHPYFRLPGVHDADIGGHILRANVTELWEAKDQIPTGWRQELPDDLDYRQLRPIGNTHLDNVFTRIAGRTTPLGELVELAELCHPSAYGSVRFMADSSFRELVLFTPPHRQAIAIEPYTCAADAANLASRGIDSGWMAISPGEAWQGSVEYCWEPAGE